MRCLGQFVGCLLLMMVAIIAPITIWTVLLWGELSNADRYTNSLSDKSYEDLTLLVLPGVAQMASGTAYEKNDNATGDALNIFSQMIIQIDIERWRIILAGQLDPNWMKDTLKTNLSNIFTYWRFESETFEIQADLEPIAEVLDGDNGAALTAAVINETRSLDACTADELDILALTLAGRSGMVNVPRCNPGEENLAILEERLELARLHLVSDLGDLPNYQFNLRDEVTETPEEVEEFDRGIFDVRRLLFLIDRTVVVLLLLPVMLMSLIVVVTVRSAKGFFLWTSLALIETSVLTLFPLMPYIYNLIINPQRPALSGSSNTDFVLGFETAGLFFSSFAPTILVAVAVMAFVGIAFLVLAALLKAPQHRAQQPVYYVMPSGTMAMSGVASTPAMTQMGPQNFQPQMAPPHFQPPIGPPSAGSQSDPSQRTPSKPSKSSKQNKCETSPVPTPAPIVPSAPEPTPPAPPISSAADRYREVLSDPNLPEDRTFIPTDNSSDTPE